MNTANVTALVGEVSERVQELYHLLLAQAQDGELPPLLVKRIGKAMLKCREQLLDVEAEMTERGPFAPAR